MAAKLFANATCENSTGAQPLLMTSNYVYTLVHTMLTKCSCLHQQTHAFPALLHIAVTKDPGADLLGLPRDHSSAQQTTEKTKLLSFTEDTLNLI